MFINVDYYLHHLNRSVLSDGYYYSYLYEDSGSEPLRVQVTKQVTKTGYKLSLIPKSVSFPPSCAAWMSNLWHYELVLPSSFKHIYLYSQDDVRNQSKCSLRRKEEEMERSRCPCILCSNLPRLLFIVSNTCMQIMHVFCGKVKRIQINQKKH